MNEKRMRIVELYCQSSNGTFKFWERYLRVLTMTEQRLSLAYTASAFQ